MNKKEFTPFIAKSVIVTFKNGDTQTGRLTAAADLSSFKCGTHGAPFKPVSVKTIEDTTPFSQYIDKMKNGTVGKEVPKYKPVVPFTSGTSRLPAIFTDGAPLAEAKAYVEMYMQGQPKWKRGMKGSWTGRTYTVTNMRGNIAMTANVKKVPAAKSEVQIAS